MSTRKQRAVSSTHSPKSTRYNALKYGIHAESQIMFDETAKDLAELAAELHEQYSPANATERFLVDTLIHNEWRLRRLRSVETDLWRQATDIFLDKHKDPEAANFGDAFASAGSAFERLQRIVNCCERNYHRALKELKCLQTKNAVRVRNLGAPQSEGSKTTSESWAASRNNPDSPEPGAPAKPARDAAQRDKKNAEATEAFDASFQSIFKQ